MASNQKTRAPDTLSLIDLSADEQVLYWSSKFGVSTDQLRTAVARAGTNPQEVAAHFLKKQSQLRRYRHNRDR